MRCEGINGGQPSKPTAQTGWPRTERASLPPRAKASCASLSSLDYLLAGRRVGLTHARTGRNLKSRSNKSTRQRKHIEDIASSRDQVLSPVEPIRYRAIGQRGQHWEMPQNFSIAGIKSDQVSVVISR